MARVVRFASGQEATEYTPGDFILTHRHRFFAGLISQAEKRRFRGADAVYAHWSHIALIVTTDGTLVEAEALGVIRSPLSKYRADEYHLVRLGADFSPEERARATGYATRQVGLSFGYLAMLGVTLYLLFGWPLRVMRRNHQICSGLVVHALQEGNQAQGLDPELALPADLAKLYDVRP